MLRFVFNCEDHRAQRERRLRVCRRWGAGVVTDVLKIAKPLVAGVAKDDRVAVSSRDYTALTGGQDPEPVAGMVGGGGC